MKKIMTSMILLVFVLFSCFNVKASEWYEVSNTIEKGEDSRELYNSMPTEVKREQYISVKVLINNTLNWKLGYGERIITWDKNAFEIVETNGKYYVEPNANLESLSLKLDKENVAHIYYQWPDSILNENSVKVLELKFKVKKNARDGIYQISQVPQEDALGLYDDNDFYNLSVYNQTLQYQIGKTILNSKYSKDEIANDTYVIGNHLFTRAGSDEYNGVLTTEYIMLASKSIESNDPKDMIIYTKNIFGEWKNAITNESVPNDKVSLPDEFKIDYIDMKAKYNQNGVYSSNDDKTILRLVQISDTEAIVTIDNDKEKIHGIATINGENITLTVGNNNYQIKINDVENQTTTIDITTSDSYITDKHLEKRANMSVNDYYNMAYGIVYYLDYVESPLNYINSKYTGKYTYGNYEMYLLRRSDTSARICIKEKGQANCVINDTLSANDGDGYYVEPTTYMLFMNDMVYGLKWNNDQIQMTCLSGTCNNDYLNTFSKENGLTMNDAFHIWEKNEIQYNVEFNPNNGEATYRIPVLVGGKLTDGDNLLSYYTPYKNDEIFMGWKVNGEGDLFDFDTVINEPITLVASYRNIPGAPTLIISPQGEGHDYYAYDDNTGIFSYHLSIELNDDYDGFDIFEKDGSSDPVASALINNSADINIATNAEKTYFARAYVLSEGEKQYGAASSEITLHPVKYTVTFNSNGGSSIPSIVVPYGSVITQPDNPVPTYSNIYVFDKWLFNNEPFDFESTINSDITLVASWTNIIPTPALSINNTNDYYVREIALSNYEDYCTSLTGCNGNEHDNYLINGYEVYEMVNEVPQILTIEGRSTFAPYETVDLSLTPNITKSYSIRVFYQETEKIYSDNYSNIVSIDTNIITPSFGVRETNDYYTREFYLANYENGYCTGTCANAATDYTSITGFEIYEIVEDEPQKLTIGGESEFAPYESVEFTLVPNKVKSYEVRVFVRQGETVTYSNSYSNIQTFDTTLAKPNIAFNPDLGVPDPANEVENWIEITNLITDFGYKCEGNTCVDYKVEGFELYKKVGIDYIAIQTFDYTVNPHVIANYNDDLHYYVRGFAYDDEGEPVYTPYSNELVLDTSNN